LLEIKEVISKSLLNHKLQLLNDNKEILMEYDGQIKMEGILGLKIKKVENDDILLFDFLENQ
jgi:hypothetical protein